MTITIARTACHPRTQLVIDVQAADDAQIVVFRRSAAGWQLLDSNRLH